MLFSSGFFATSVNFLPMVMLGKPTKFATAFTIATVASLAAKAMLNGPWTQLRIMTARLRRPRSSERISKCDSFFSKREDSHSLSRRSFERGRSGAAQAPVLFRADGVDGDDTLHLLRVTQLLPRCPGRLRASRGAPVLPLRRHAGRPHETPSSPSSNLKSSQCGGAKETLSKVFWSFCSKPPRVRRHRYQAALQGHRQDRQAPRQTVLRRDQRLTHASKGPTWCRSKAHSLHGCSRTHIYRPIPAFLLSARGTYALRQNWLEPGPLSVNATRDIDINS